MITFFTTAKPFHGITAIQQENCLQSLLHSAPGCEIFLFDAVEGAAEVCERLGLPAPLEVERSSQDTPRIDSMFGEVARRAKFPISCFINCDILITPKFTEIVTRLHEELKTDYLLVGQRLNFDCEEALFPNDRWEARLQELAASGEVHPPAGSDQFIYPTGLFNRENMPPLLVGRAAWDNWMFYETLRHGRKLVDLSPDYLVYHQNHDYKFRKINFTGYDTDPEAAWNRQFMPKRGRGIHAYKLNRCGWELYQGQLRPKPLLFPAQEAERLVAGGPEAAQPGAVETPVVLILFRRADTLRQVIDSIRSARPKILYAIADTALEDDSATIAKCEAARAELDRIDWPCRLRTNFASENLGLGHRIKSGLDWVFLQEERAIILEDDIVVGEDFFPFCETMLERYRDEPRVGSVSAITFSQGDSLPGADYYYSRYPHCWGWATWRRAWQGFDLWMERWPEIRRHGLLQSKFAGEENQLNGWMRIFDEAYRGKWDTWDFQWTLHGWMKDEMTIHPAVSLTRNVGNGADATHTHADSTTAEIKIGKIHLPPQAPAEFIRHKTADERTFVAIYDYYKSSQKALALPPEKIAKTKWKKPSILGFLRQLRQNYRLQTVLNAMQAGDMSYVSKNLPQSVPKDSIEWSDLYLKIQVLLAKGEGQEVAKLLKAQKQMVANNPLLLVLRRYLKEKELKNYPRDFQEIARLEPASAVLSSFPRDVPGSVVLKIGEIDFTDARSLARDYADYFCRRILRFGSIRKDPLVIDCGPGIGLDLLAIKKQFADARILAFEPDAEIFQLLQKNVGRKNFSDVTLHSQAIGPVDGEMTYNRQSAYARNLGLGVYSCKVPAVRLSPLLTEPVAFLRLNVDGAEIAVLEEAREELHRVDAMLVEYLSADNSFGDLPRLLEEIRNAGFRVQLETVDDTETPPLRKYSLPDERRGRLRIYCTR